MQVCNPSVDDVAVAVVVVAAAVVKTMNDSCHALKKSFLQQLMQIRDKNYNNNNNNNNNNKKEPNLLFRISFYTIFILGPILLLRKESKKGKELFIVGVVVVVWPFTVS